MEGRKEFTDNRYSYDKLLPMFCGNCGVTENLHIHHIVPLSFGGTNKISNMVRLCEECHGKAHGSGNWLKGHVKGINKARQQLRDDGKWAGGIIPYGYKINKQGYLDFSLDAETVKKILTDFYVFNKKIGAIKKELECSGILTPKGKNVWQHSTLATILKNTTYIGEVRDRWTDEITIQHDKIMIDLEYINIVREGMNIRKNQYIEHAK